MFVPPTAVKPPTAKVRRAPFHAKRSFGMSLAALGAMLLASNCNDGKDRSDAVWRPVEAQRVQEPSQAVETELSRFDRNADEALARIDEKLTHIQDRIDLGRPGVTQETHTKLEELRKRRGELANEAKQTSDRVKAELVEKTRTLDRSFADLGRSADDVLRTLGDDQVRLRKDEQTAAPAEK